MTPIFKATSPWREGAFIKAVPGRGVPVNVRPPGARALGWVSIAASVLPDPGAPLLLC